MLTSSKNSVFSSSCSPVLFTAASTLPPEGAGEECAESAGRGETLSSLLTLPVLALSASSSSSLDRTTAEETLKKTQYGNEEFVSLYNLKILIGASFYSLGSLSSSCWADVVLFPLGAFLAPQQLEVPANRGDLPFRGSMAPLVLVMRMGRVSPRGALMVVAGL